MIWIPHSGREACPYPGMSMRISLFWLIPKAFMRRVRPGFEEVLARDLLLRRALRREDF